MIGPGLKRKKKVVAAMKRASTVELFLEGNNIVDQKGQQVSVDDARALLAQGRVTNSNLSFQRLSRFDFDFDKLRAFYDEMDARGHREFASYGSALREDDAARP